MVVGGLNVIRQAIAKQFPVPTGMGNKGFAEYCCPVTLSGGGKVCNLQSDPLIAVSRANDIAKRSVAKPSNPGTIKESWAVGDWKITISGVVIAETKEDLANAIREISDICALRESVEITCNVLNDLYDVTRVAIENLELPSTPGMLNQQFSITAVSDTSHELLEEI